MVVAAGGRFAQDVDIEMNGGTVAGGTSGESGGKPGAGGDGERVHDNITWRTV
jgi:hypothetical protein